MEAEDKECEHEFIIDGPDEYGTLGETIEVPMRCTICEKRVKEIWIYSCTIDENGKIL